MTSIFYRFLIFHLVIIVTLGFAYTLRKQLLNKEQFFSRNYKFIFIIPWFCKLKTYGSTVSVQLCKQSEWQEVYSFKLWFTNLWSQDFDLCGMSTTKQLVYLRLYIVFCCYCSCNRRTYHDTDCYLTCNMCCRTLGKLCFLSCCKDTPLLEELS